MNRSSVLLIALLASPLALAAGTGPTYPDDPHNNAPQPGVDSTLNPIASRAMTRTARPPSRTTIVTCQAWTEQGPKGPVVPTQAALAAANAKPVAAGPGTGFGCRPAPSIHHPLIPTYHSA